MQVIVKTLNDQKIKINIDREELIYGATAVLTNQTKEDFVIHPITKEKILVIQSEKNRFFIPAHIQEDYEYAKSNGMKIKQVVAPYFYGTGKETVKNEEKTQFRHSVIAVIKDDVEEKYLCVDCKNRDCKSFVLGGIEDGETNIEAAIREVREETGYTDVVIEKISDISIYNHFYAEYKGVNRFAILDILFGKLLTKTREQISEEENNKHVVKWINKEELRNFLNINNNLYVLEELYYGSKAYEKEEGKMINSFDLDRLDIFEARNITKEKLKEENNK